VDFYTNVMKKNNRIYVRGYMDGKRYTDKVKFQPSLFVPSPTNTEFKTIHGAYVKEIVLESPNHLWDFTKKYQDVEGFTYHGYEDCAYQYVYKTFPEIKTEHDKSLIKTCIIDIEVDISTGYPDIDAGDKPINAITILYKDITIAFGFGDYTPTADHIKYIKCSGEMDLIRKFLKVWDSAKFSPDVVSGWNIEGFDIPYLVNRITRMFDSDKAKELSPWRHLTARTVKIYGKDHTLYFPAGIAVLDYLPMYKKFVAVLKPQESYKLDHIAFVELGEKKLDYSDYGSLAKLATENHQLFIEYNIRDCELVDGIDKVQNLFNLVYDIAYSSGVNFGDAIGTVKSWDSTIHAFLMDQNIVIPRKVNNVADRKPVGGYVKPPLVGGYTWVVSFDFTALYPHLIMQYNIGPDTYHSQLPKDFTTEELIDNKHHEYSDWLTENNLSMAANSCVYTNNKMSFLSRLMKSLFEERKIIKKQMLKEEQRKADGVKGLDGVISGLDTLQYSIKVRLNACYGALANQHFRWYDIKYAESITKSGQLGVKWAQHIVNNHLNEYLGTQGVDYIIAIDTDSIYINMAAVDAKIGHWNTMEGKKECSIEDKAMAIDAFCEHQLEKLLSDAFESLRESMNAKEQALHMKREAIADRCVFIAKKRYLMNIRHNEEVIYTEPKVKIVGIESARSSTPVAVRQAIKDIVKLALQKDEQSIQEYIAKFRKSYETLPFTEIAKASTANGLTSYASSDTIFIKGTPQHTKAALLYNSHITKSDVDLEPIFEGEKIKYMYLREPNPMGCDVIAVPSQLPKELGLEEYLDRDLQFEKTLIKPIKAILDILGWAPEKINKMSDFWE
jgi:DNA polymerase elongation subunit (family B)